MKFLPAEERFAERENLAVRSQMLGRALVSGKVLAEPALDKIPLFGRYHPVPLQAAVVLAVLGDHISAVVGHANQAARIATFTVVGGVDDMAISWHKSSIPRIPRKQANIRQMVDTKRI